MSIAEVEPRSAVGLPCFVAPVFVWCSWDQPFALLDIQATIQYICHAPEMTLTVCGRGAVLRVLQQPWLVLSFLVLAIES